VLQFCPSALHSRSPVDALTVLAFAERTDLPGDLRARVNHFSGGLNGSTLVLVYLAVGTARFLCKPV
jgi:hypothetical protein